MRRRRRTTLADVEDLEPCLAVFRADTREVLRHDEDARRLRGQLVTLADALTCHALTTGARRNVALTPSCGRTATSTWCSDSRPTRNCFPVRVTQEWRPGMGHHPPHRFG